MSFGPGLVYALEGVGLPTVGAFGLFNGSVIVLLLLLLEDALGELEVGVLLNVRISLKKILLPFFLTVQPLQ